MRQVFSSQRLENVEGVAQLLRDAGIEVRVTDGRSYKGKRRSHFSYSERSSEPQPTVWVVKSEDQPRARQMLREAGLMDSTRDGQTAPMFRFDPRTQQGSPRTAAQQRAFRIKLGLIGGIGVVVSLMMVRSCTQPPVATDFAAPPFDGRVAATFEPLARAVFAAELGKVSTPVACLAVDGKDASRAVLQGLGSARQTVVPASQCVRLVDEERGSFHRGSGREASIVEVTTFRPSARDAGTIEFSAYHHRMYASYKTLEVRRGANGWAVTKTLKHVSM